MRKEAKSKLSMDESKKSTSLQRGKKERLFFYRKSKNEKISRIQEIDHPIYGKIAIVNGPIAGSTVAPVRETVYSTFSQKFGGADYRKTEDWVSLLDNQIYLNNLSKQGVPYDIFLSIAAHSPFSGTDWANFLSINEKRLFSSRNKESAFSQGQSEIILQIAQLQRLGEDVFGSTENFAIWASTPNPSLEGKQPKSFLDGTFGIQMLTAELHRIEHGILV